MNPTDPLSSLHARLLAVAEHALSEADLSHASVRTAHADALALHSRLQHHQATLHSAPHLQHLEHLEHAAATAEHQVDSLSEHFLSRISAFSHEIDEKEGALDQALTATIAEVEARGRRVAELGMQLDASLARSLIHVEELRQAADTCITNISGKGQFLISSLEEMEHRMDELLQLLNHALMEAIQLLEHRLNATEQLLGMACAATLDAGQRAFLDEALRHLEQATGTLSASIEGLGQGTHHSRGPLEGGASQLLGKMQGVVHAIDQVRPVLDMIQSVLT